MLKSICPVSLLERFRLYDYDVLYPEAVIWAIRKLENVGYAKAEAKYKSGFPLTDEEKIKLACNQLLNEMSSSNDIIEANSNFNATQVNTKNT